VTDSILPQKSLFYCGGYSVLRKDERWGAEGKSLGVVQKPWIFFEKDICKITANAQFTSSMFSRKLLANRKLLKLKLIFRLFHAIKIFFGFGFQKFLPRYKKLPSCKRKWHEKITVLNSFFSFLLALRPNVGHVLLIHDVF
jgi:hypothetical protein